MSGKHIFLADDEELIRISLSAILRKAGYQVTTAKDGKDALQQITDMKKTCKPPDLLLTDIKMPIMSGVELIDELEKRDIVLPVLAITGYGDKETVVELMRRGCADYIDKPFKPHELLDRLSRIFKKNIKNKVASEKQTAQLVHEKFQLNRQIESCMHKFEKLREQMDLAVGAYQNLICVREETYKVRVAYRHQPLAELGGDFIDVRNIPAGCDILMADVAGHDMGASYHAILIKALFDENCRTGNDGQSFFRLLNKQLLENGKNERMVTALFLHLNLEAMHAEVVSAGHLPMIRFLKRTPVPEPIKATGDVLGIHDHVDFDIRTLPLTSGDRFFLHTDGLTNAYRLNEHTREKEKLGSRGFHRMIEKYSHLSLEKMIGQIENAVTESHNYKFNDDMLLFGVEIP